MDLSLNKLPWYAQVGLFVTLAALNSLGWLHALQDPLNLGSRACLMLGVAGLGMKTSFPHLASAGWRLVLLMVATGAWLAAVSLGAAWALGI